MSRSDRLARLIPGTFLGLAVGVVMLILAMQQGGHPDFNVRNPLLLASLRAGTLSGFFTAFNSIDAFSSGRLGGTLKRK
jgi:hypothetical protein